MTKKNGMTDAVDSRFRGNDKKKHSVGRGRDDIHYYVCNAGFTDIRYIEKSSYCIIISLEVFMLTEYIDEALKRAKYEIIEDEEPYYGEIEELPGVWATGKTLEECRNNLKEVIEGWILVSTKKGLKIPKLGSIEINKVEEVSV